MRGNPNYDVFAMKEAYDYLIGLDIDSIDNRLWNCLHQIVWHKGIDRVDWILKNKALIQEIIKYSTLTPLPEDLNLRFWDSVHRHKKLDR
jgi:hypothetical protein